MRSREQVPEHKPIFSLLIFLDEYIGDLALIEKSAIGLARLYIYRQEQLSPLIRPFAGRWQRPQKISNDGRGVGFTRAYDLFHRNILERGLAINLNAHLWIVPSERSM